MCVSSEWKCKGVVENLSHKIGREKPSRYWIVITLCTKIDSWKSLLKFESKINCEGGKTMTLNLNKKVQFLRGQSY
jgi:hypothetical protein